MSQKRNFKNTLIIVLGIAIISVSAVYAAFDVGLEKSYAFPESKTKLDVHLENPQKTANTSESVVEINPLSISEDAKSVSFTSTLNPGETYEFTIDVRNSGSLNAKLDSYELVAVNNGKTQNVPNGIDANSYLTYTITNTEEGEVIPKKEYSLKRITIKANENIPVDNTTFDFTFNINYIKNR